MNEPAFLWPHTGAILTHGHGPRTGTSPEGVRMWDGRTMIEHLLKPMLQVCPSVVIVGDNSGSPHAQSERIQQIRNPKPEPEHLGALEALLASGLDSGYLVTCCDQPFLTFSLLRQLTEGNPNRPHLFLVPRGISFYPFPGYYPASLLETVRQTLASDHPTMRSLCKKCPPLWIPLSEMEEHHLLSVNVPAHFEKLQHLAGHNNLTN